jgi:hypothetical protein
MKFHASSSAQVVGQLDGTALEYDRDRQLLNALGNEGWKETKIKV